LGHSVDREKKKDLLTFDWQSGSRHCFFVPVSHRLRPFLTFSLGLILRDNKYTATAHDAKITTTACIWYCNYDDDNYKDYYNYNI